MKTSSLYEIPSSLGREPRKTSSDLSFGNVPNETNTQVADSWEYTARELYSETGLQFNRAR